ncbi:MAG: hypothetical protein KAX26_07000, partial [Anaerolineae bacterium]|nr:hypothetical protein [Anaerolineae bacterium]
TAAAIEFSTHQVYNTWATLNTPHLVALPPGVAFRGTTESIFADDRTGTIDSRWFLDYNIHWLARSRIIVISPPSDRLRHRIDLP